MTPHTMPAPRDETERETMPLEPDAVQWLREGYDTGRGLSGRACVDLVRYINELRAYADRVVPPVASSSEFDEHTVTGNDGKLWPETMDGLVWARAFNKQFPCVSVDDALGWFCNAIMRGRDSHANSVLRAPKYPTATLSDGSVMEYRKGEVNPWCHSNVTGSIVVDLSCLSAFNLSDDDTAACVALMSVPVVDLVREALVRILTSDDPPLSGKLDAIVALINQHAAPERAP